MRRLFPTAYPDDADAEAYYRLMAGEELVARRLSALDALEKASNASHLTVDDALRFLAALNDLRLVLGTRLDVSEDDDLDQLDPDAPETPSYHLYHYLGWLLELTVEALQDQ